VAEAEAMAAANPEQFHWLTLAALRFYITWRSSTGQMRIHS
jgi:hypothetical protein